jgi:hypothetical protein
MFARNLLRSARAPLLLRRAPPALRGCGAPLPALHLLLTSRAGLLFSTEAPPPAAAKKDAGTQLKEAKLKKDAGTQLKEAKLALKEAAAEIKAAKKVTKDMAKELAAAKKARAASPRLLFRLSAPPSHRDH